MASLLFGGGYSIPFTGGTPFFSGGCIDYLIVIYLIFCGGALPVFAEQKARINQFLERLSYGVLMNATDLRDGLDASVTVASTGYMTKHPEDGWPQTPIIEITVNENCVVHAAPYLEIFVRADMTCSYWKRFNRATLMTGISPRLIMLEIVRWLQPKRSASCFWLINWVSANA